MLLLPSNRSKYLCQNLVTYLLTAHLNIFQWRFVKIKHSIPITARYRAETVSFLILGFPPPAAFTLPICLSFSFGKAVVYHVVPRSISLFRCFVPLLCSAGRWRNERYLQETLPVLLPLCISRPRCNSAKTIILKFSAYFNELQLSPGLEVNNVFAGITSAARQSSVVK